MDALTVYDHGSNPEVLGRPRAGESPVPVYLARLSPGSRRAQAQAIRAIIAIIVPGADPLTFPWSRCEYQHSQALRAQLATTYAPATSNRILAAFRGVLKEAWRLGQMSAEQYQRAADVEPVRGTRLPKGRSLGPFELRALFEACDRDDPPAGLRDAALIAILYAGGLRRSEAVALDAADWGMGDGSVRVRAGKGSKGRLVFLADGAAERIERWLDCRGRHDGALFTRIYKGGHLSDRRLSDQAVRYVLLQRCEDAHIRPASPHDLRRSCASDLLDAGVDISTVQAQLGHSSVNTTQKYDRRGDQTRRKAVQALRVP